MSHLEAANKALKIYSCKAKKNVSTKRQLDE